MTSNNSDSINPVFSTPNPEELKSEESRSTVREQLADNPETEVEPEEQKSKPPDPATLLGDADGPADSHLPQTSNPPG